MRGALLQDVNADNLKRIIPADAGSTAPAPVSRSEGEDHPRGCGEHLAHMTDDHRFGGSSPRMRGAHNWLELTTPYKRIIPADAGSTNST